MTLEEKINMALTDADFDSIPDHALDYIVFAVREWAIEHAVIEDEFQESMHVPLTDFDVSEREERDLIGYRRVREYNEE
jgi:hypothetical protein